MAILGNVDLTIISKHVAHIYEVRAAGVRLDWQYAVVDAIEEKEDAVVIETPLIVVPSIGVKHNGVLG
jgi:hypothetical protein